MLYSEVTVYLLPSSSPKLISDHLPLLRATLALSHSSNIGYKLLEDTFAGKLKCNGNPWQKEMSMLVSS